MNKKVLSVLLILSILSFLGVCFLYPSLPARVPTNWGVNGSVLYSEKKTVFLIAAFPMLFSIGFALFPKIDPRRRNYDKHQKAYTIVVVAVLAMLLAALWMIVLAGLEMQPPVSVLVRLLVGLLLLVMGNYMPQFRSNFFVGIRTPWALSSENVWRKTHRLGGVLMCFAGGITMFSAVLPEMAAFAVMMVSCLLSAVVPAVYSYVLYTKLVSK